MLLQWVLESHRVTLCGGRSQLRSVPLEYSSCQLRYMQALDWLSEKDCFEATVRVLISHDLESDQANISVHHLSMWLCKCASIIP